MVSLSLVNGLRPLRRTIATGILRAVTFALPGLLSLVPATFAQEAAHVTLQAATLQGTVRDSSGRTVADARVILTAKNAAASRETTTDAAGHFTFAGVSTGDFTLSASSGTSRATATVSVSAPGEQPVINLVLSNAGPRGTAQRDSSQAMQFADNPDFAIAAVTDWTAAGGHGSDSILRASEALNRQAVNLKSGEGQATPPSPPGGAELKESESALRAAAEKDPQGFAANYQLGRFYLQSGRYAEAIPPLQAAYQADPTNFDNEYDLAQALTMAGDTAQAREHVVRLLAQHSSANLHGMEGELDEKLGDPLSAVHELQEAASEDPSEENFFAWGSELLLHRAIWQAKEVFDEGTRFYPDSARMLTARGAALFASAMYDEAALDLCRASDLVPANAEPYLFMGKIEVSAPNPLPCVVEKLARFEKLQPTNSLANYYYAMALWKQQGVARDPQQMERVQAMLSAAVRLDPKCADGYLQLGNLSASQKQWEQAVDLYLKAIEADPDLSEAHYRLGVAYERVGEESKAKEQFQLHDTIARKQAVEIQRQRESVKQFLVVLQNHGGKKQTP
jgi:tetratricopeptide (TPR) repeat protein